MLFIYCFLISSCNVCLTFQAKWGPPKAGVYTVSCFVTIIPITGSGISWGISTNPLESTLNPAMVGGLTNPNLNLLLWGSLALKANKPAMSTARNSRITTMGALGFFHTLSTQKEPIIFQVVKNVI